MRRALIVCCITLVLGSAAFGADSPVAKGSMMLSGGFSYFSQSGDLYEIGTGEALNTYTIVPGFGYFISPGLMIGADLSFINITRGSASRHTFSFGPTITYYVGADRANAESKGMVFPYLGAFAALGTTTSDVTTTSFGGQGGIVYMVSNAVGIDCGVNISFDKWSVDSYSTNGTSLQVAAGITAFVF